MSTDGLNSAKDDVVSNYEVLVPSKGRFASSSRVFVGGREGGIASVGQLRICRDAEVVATEGWARVTAESIGGILHSVLRGCNPMRIGEGKQGGLRIVHPIIVNIALVRIGIVIRMPTLFRLAAEKKTDRRLNQDEGGTLSIAL